MTNKRTLGRAALISNGMVWFGSALFFLAWALEQAPNAVAGTGWNILGWLLLILVGIGLAIAGVLENRNIRRRTSRAGNAGSPQ